MSGGWTDEQSVREEGGTTAMQPDSSAGEAAVGTSDQQADMAASGAETGGALGSVLGGSQATDSDGAAVGGDDLAADIERSGGDV